MTHNPQGKLVALKDDWATCERCTLSILRTGQPLMNDNPRGKYLFLEEAPNEEDEGTQKILAGHRGDLLRAILKNVGIHPTEVHLGYAVACRPKALIEATETEPEREETLPASKEALLACRPRVYQTIYQVDPRIIIAFGKLTLKGIGALDNWGKKAPNKISTAHGQLYQVSIPGVYFPVTYPVMGCLSLDYAIKNPSVAAHGPTAQITKALKRARNYVEWVEENEK